MDENTGCGAYIFLGMSKDGVHVTLEMAMGTMLPAFFQKYFSFIFLGFNRIRSFPLSFGSLKNFSYTYPCSLLKIHDLFFIINKYIPNITCLVCIILPVWMFSGLTIVG